MPVAKLKQSAAPPAMARKLYSFLLLDQYDSGIWGASLERSVLLYGARSDPGSITVSVACSLALRSLSDGLLPPPMRRFREYLVSRHSKKGAFGMRHDGLARGYRVDEIREHTRHTATGGLFFLDMDGPEHDFVIDAVRYLVDPAHRTASGYWGEEAGGPDECADPITAAYVVGFLESVRLSTSTTSLSRRYPISAEVLEKAVDDGLDYLFVTYQRTDKGGWLYRFKNDEEYQRVLGNEYAYTADVLNIVAPAVVRTGRHLAQYVESLESLRRLSRANRGTLPPGRNSNIPDLAATIYFAEAMEQCALFAGEGEEIRRSARTLAVLPEVFEATGAHGWAAMLRDAGGAELVVSSETQTKWAHEVALINKGERPTGPFWATMFREHGDFIETLLQTKARIRGGTPHLIRIETRAGHGHPET